MDISNRMKFGFCLFNQRNFQLDSLELLSQNWNGISCRGGGGDSRSSSRRRRSSAVIVLVVVDAVPHHKTRIRKPSCTPQ